MENIFDSNYFNSAMESDEAIDASYYEFVMEANHALGTAFAGWFSPLVQTIHRLAYQSDKESAIVISVPTMQNNGVPSDKAKKLARDTVREFVEQGFLPEYYASNNIKVIYYSDLTPLGKQFMDGYYDALDRIEPYDIQKAMSAKVKSDWHKGSSWGTGFALARTISYAIALIYTAHPALILPLLLSSLNLEYFTKERQGAQLFDSTYMT